MATIEDGVFDAIKSGKVKMKPRWYFILRGVLLVVGVAILLIFLIYLASFIIFALRQSGVWFAPDFGFAGWYLFFRSLPGVLILLSLLFIVVLALLARQYSFVYHRPLLYFLLFIVVIIGLGSFLLAATAFHPSFVQYAVRNNIPIIGSFYQYELAPPRTVHQGLIIGISSSTFTIQSAMGNTSTVVFSASSSYEIGDTVIVFGERDMNGIIRPFGIEKVQ